MTGQASGAAYNELPDLFGNYPGDGPFAMPGQGDSRIVARMLDVWQRNCPGGRAMPQPSLISDEELRSLWPNLFMIDLRVPEASGDCGPMGARVRIGDLGPNDPSVQTGWRKTVGLRAVPQLLWRMLVPVMDAVIAERRPLSRSGDFGATNGGALYFRAVVLPMSDDDQRVSHLLGAISCKWRDQIA